MENREIAIGNIVKTNEIFKKSQEEKTLLKKLKSDYKKLNKK